MSKAKIHKSQHGDTLEKLAARYYVSVDELLAVNPGITNQNLLTNHLIVQIPPAKFSDYQIQPGDTLSQIAHRHGTTISDIQKANPQIKDIDLIYSGDNLKIPTERSTTKPSLPSTIQTPPQMPPIETPIIDTPIGPKLEPPASPTASQTTQQPPEQQEISSEKKTEKATQKSEPTTEKSTKSVEQQPEQTEKSEAEKAKEKVARKPNEPCEPCQKECCFWLGCGHKGKRAQLKEIPKDGYYGMVPTNKRKLTDLVTSTNVYTYLYVDVLEIIITGGNAPDSIEIGMDTIDGVKDGSDVAFRKELSIRQVQAGIILKQLSFIEALHDLFLKEARYETYKVKGKCIDSFDARVYDPDEWELKIQMPRIKPRKMGIASVTRLSRERTVAGRDNQDETWQQAGPWRTVSFSDPSERIQHPAANSPAGAPPATINLTPPETSVELRHNGELVKIDIIDIIGGILTLVNNINKIVQLLEEIKNVRLGFYVDFSFGFLTETCFAMKVSNQEKDDHTVAKTLEVVLEGKIFFLMLEAGFGICLFIEEYYIKAYLRITVEIISDFSIKVEIPGDDEVSTNIKFVVQPEVGAELKLGDNLTLSAKGVTAFEGVLKFQLYPEIKVTFKAEMKPIELVIVKEKGKGAGRRLANAGSPPSTATTGIEDDETKKEDRYTIIAGKEWDEITILGKNQTEFKPGYLPESQIKAKLKDRLTEDFNIQVKKVMGGRKIDIEMDEIIRQIYLKIQSHPTFSRDMKSVEALSLEIDDYLTKIGDGKWYEPDYVEYDKFSDFINGGRLDNMIEKYVSQDLDLQNKVKQQAQSSS